MHAPATTWQTVGPYFRIGMDRLMVADIAGEGVQGQRVRVLVRVLDGDGAPIPDGVLEVWQANSQGKYAHPEDTQDKPLEQGFRGYGRVGTDDDGWLRFDTVKPGPVPGPANVEQAPHLVVGLMMRGLLKRLVTRMYFPGEPMNGTDPILELVDVERRRTLVARAGIEDAKVLTWEIHMQGKDETVFFEL